MKKVGLTILIILAICMVAGHSTYIKEERQPAASSTTESASSADTTQYVSVDELLKNGYFSARVIFEKRWSDKNYPDPFRVDLRHFSAFIVFNSEWAITHKMSEQKFYQTYYPQYWSAFSSPR